MEQGERGSEVIEVELARGGIGIVAEQWVAEVIEQHAQLVGMAGARPHGHLPAGGAHIRRGGRAVRGDEHLARPAGFVHAQGDFPVYEKRLLDDAPIPLHRTPLQEDALVSGAGFEIAGADDEASGQAI